MFARWAKTAKAFTKLGKEIAIAVKLGGIDPNGNPRLRMAIRTARTLNMPKDRIEAAIKRASSKDAAELHEITYEGFGPHGVGIVVEAATDNGTRTVANVRNFFERNGGNLAAQGALNYTFDRKSVFNIATPSGDIDELELELMDHGLEDVFETDGGLMIYGEFKHFNDIQRVLESRGIEVHSAAIQRIPNNYVKVTPEQEQEVQKLIEKLEEDDDVQAVFHNMQTEE